MYLYIICLFLYFSLLLAVVFTQKCSPYCCCLLLPNFHNLGGERRRLKEMISTRNKQFTFATRKYSERTRLMIHNNKELSQFIIFQKIYNSI